jgi:aspartate/methionine/tyrosine aminotransferase
MRLGDLDLNMKDLVISYGDHVGHPKLRELIAKDAGVPIESVLLTVGAQNALFIVMTTLLGKNDRVLVEHPNYPPSLEVPHAIGSHVDIIELKFENAFRPSISEIESKIRVGETKLVIITAPHNPTGASISSAELNALVSLTKEKGVHLLVDETDREIAFNEILPVAASFAPHVISVSSMSKVYGVPGIRIGWVICQDKILMEKFLAAKEHIVLCGSVVDEEIAYRLLLNRDKYLPAIKKEVEARLHLVKEWMNAQQYLEWVEPEGSVLCFPRIKVDVSPEAFYEVLNKKFETFVGPGSWFEMDRKYMRIGYGWAQTRDELVQGLNNITAAFKICLQNQKLTE